MRRVHNSREAGTQAPTRGFFPKATSGEGSRQAFAFPLSQPSGKGQECGRNLCLGIMHMPHLNSHRLRAFRPQHPAGGAARFGQDDARPAPALHPSSALLRGGPRIRRRSHRRRRHPRPGEVSLAHHVVLCLSELPEFRRDALESLRPPRDSGVVTPTGPTPLSPIPLTPRWWRR
jgi:hypothetical protein